MDRVLAAGTVQTQIFATLRAVTVSGLNRRAALRAGRAAWLPQYEIQHDAERVGDEDREQRPTKAAHSAAAGITVHIPDQQDVTPQGSSSDNCEWHHSANGKGGLPERVAYTIAAKGIKKPRIANK